MDDSEKQQKLRAEIERDTARIGTLQQSLKEKKRRLHELEQTEILNRAGELRAQGLNVTKILDAIRAGDADTILTYLKKE